MIRTVQCLAHVGRVLLTPSKRAAYYLWMVQLDIVMHGRGSRWPAGATSAPQPKQAPGFRSGKPEMCPQRTRSSKLGHDAPIPEARVTLNDITAVQSDVGASADSVETEYAAQLSSEAELAHLRNTSLQEIGRSAALRNPCSCSCDMRAYSPAAAAFEWYHTECPRQGVDHWKNVVNAKLKQRQKRGACSSAH